MTPFNSRLAGMLLHPTSLPGPHGSGDLGPDAFHFVDWLRSAGLNVWQVLPLAPPGPGNSPYASVSAFAGSPLLVALEPLIEKAWLAAPAAQETSGFDAQRLDFTSVAPWRMDKLRSAQLGFERHASASDRLLFNSFRAAQAHWLDDYALFMALDQHFRAQGIWSWAHWDAPLARRESGALAGARMRYATDTRFWQFVQWCFFEQWTALKRYANVRGVHLIGDLPIFVAHHSADCWAHRDLFQLDEHLEPQVVAGVPPDFFSATGQRWGNPLYNWSAMQRNGFAWWIARMRHELQRADMVRVDHFRGFAGYWEIPASCPTAIEGRWVDAPGQALFETLLAALGSMPVIAEDLGFITPDVEMLRDGFGLPGMKILQFAFGGDADHAFLPHNFDSNCCVYTGTHDNDTARGWWHGATQRERQYASTYLGTSAENVHWAMIRAAWASVAKLAVCQMQDALGLGSDHRMNTPGLLGCWTWRFDWRQVGPEPALRLAELGAAYGRAPIDRLGLQPYPSNKPLP